MLTRKSLLCPCLFFLLTLEAAAFAQPQVSLGIMPFLSRTREIGTNQAAQITDIITRILHVSRSISVIERERLRVIAMEHGLNTGSVNQDSAVKIGQLAGCKYILLGSITQLTQRYLSARNTSLFSFGDERALQESTATLEARLIDVTTGRVALSFSQSGSALISSDDEKKSRSGSDLAMQAIEAASSRLSDEVREVLADEHAMIISVNKKNIRINRGSMSGVNVGALYKVYEEGEEVFDLNGASLGKRSINRAIVRVTDVSSEFSTVEVLEEQVSASKKLEDKKAKKETTADKTKKTGRASKGKSRGRDSGPSPIVREGDRIEAISFSEAEKLKLNPTGRS
ncbi:MAG: hypothetical protein IJR68_03045 [Fretibacterium sp.]|nr:hypothetical protein [Fretibacterium sp.]